MSVSLLKRELSVGDPVRVEWSDDDGFGCQGFGFVTGPIYTDPIEGSVLPVEWYSTGEASIAYLDDETITRTSGCECGNPFTLCHPEA